jgi:hypothetical protein
MRENDLSSVVLNEFHCIWNTTKSFFLQSLYKCPMKSNMSNYCSLVCIPGVYWELTVIKTVNNYNWILKYIMNSQSLQTDIKTVP